jgi:hypothetical protein
MYLVSDWYWIVGGDAANVWSSARAMSVPVSDADYTAWLVANSNPSPIATMADLHALLAAQYPPGSLETYCVFKRWQKEQGGITLTSGMPIATDDRAQAKINGVRLAILDAPGGTTQWHAADGTYWPLDVAAITAMSNELQAHINNCFTISSDTMAAIAGGTITTLTQIDSAFESAVRKTKKK